MVDTIIFFKIMDDYYFKFRNMNYELNGINLSYLKDNIVFPCRVEFYNFSKGNIGRILKVIIDRETIVKSKYNEEENSYELLLLKSEHQRRMLKTGNMI